MKKAKFSLQPLLNIKQLLEKEEKNVLSAIVVRLNSQIDELDELQDDLRRRAGEYNREAASGISVGDAAGYISWMRYLWSGIEEQKHNITRTEREKDECIKRLVGLMTEKKAFECLKNKEFEQFTAILKKEYEEAVNEYLSCRFTRKEVKYGDISNESHAKDG